MFGKCQQGEGFCMHVFSSIMDNEPGISIEADKNLAALGDGWTKSLKNIPEF